MKKAVLLLSGGLDSTTTLAIAKAQGFEVYALSFAYGQRHKHELAAAEIIAKKYGVKEHRVQNSPPISPCRKIARKKRWRGIFL